MNTLEMLDIIIMALQRMQERPISYVGEETEIIVSYLNGFRYACGIFGLLTGYDDIHMEVIASKGWSQNSFGPWKEFMAAGLTTHDAINELLNIEIEVWNQIRNKFISNVSYSGFQAG